MWPFNKKKDPDKYPILQVHNIGQKVTFVRFPDRVLYVHQITTQYHWSGRLEIRIEASEL